MHRKLTKIVIYKCTWFLYVSSYENIQKCRKKYKTIYLPRVKKIREKKCYVYLLWASDNKYFVSALTTQERNVEEFLKKCWRNVEEMFSRYYMDNSRFKSLTTHWCVTRRERVNSSLIFKRRALFPRENDLILFLVSHYCEVIMFKQRIVATFLWLFLIFFSNSVCVVI